MFLQIMRSGCLDDYLMRTLVDAKNVSRRIEQYGSAVSGGSNRASEGRLLVLIIRQPYRVVWKAASLNPELHFNRLIANQAIAKTQQHVPPEKLRQTH